MKRYFPAGADRAAPPCQGCYCAVKLYPSMLGLCCLAALLDLLMNRLLLAVDRLSTRLGHLFAWAIVALTLLIGFEVVSRYFFDNPHAWVFDATYMLYGVLFMMAGAYTLAKNGHVRGDVLYGFFQPRTQAFFDLVLYLVFFIPGIVALVWAGWTFAAESIALGEHSSVTADGPPIYPFKAIIPLAGLLLLLQGFVEIIRCIICLRDGDWPSREEDVEEVDVDKLKAMVSAEGFDAQPGAAVAGHNGGRHA